MARVKTVPTLNSSSGKVRPGRPRSENAGKVDERLLDAATQLFLSLGYEATSCDQVASMAGAGKGSLYARYESKQELFAAVIRRTVERTTGTIEEPSADLPLPERLHAVGIEILQRALQPESLAVMRLVIATATRFPELARLADQIGWESGVNRVAAVITARSADPSMAHLNARPVAAWFISLTFAPQQLRALLGDSHPDLLASAPERVAGAIHLLAKSDWLVGWR